jgi:hypothetical protein
MARKRMSESDLKAALDQQLSDAVDYDQSELRQRRISAIDYYEGRMPDLPSLPNRSQVVSHDLADTIGWIMPGLLRVFLSAEHVVVYEPRKPESEAAAKQATDYVNYLFQAENEGYRVLHAGFFDGLQFGNGVIKHWWDDTPEYVTESHSNLTDDAFMALMAKPEIEEALEHDERVEVVAVDPQTGQPIELKFHDVKVKRRTSSGRLMVLPIPGEEFAIERNATALDEQGCRFCAHRKLRMRSELIEDGYDRAKVEALPHYTALENDEERAVREQFITQDDNAADQSTERVEISECYLLVDYDGDGIAEWRKVVVGGGSGAITILANDEWGDDLPFSDLVPDPVPHRWRGRSMFDETEDLQRIKTVLMRQTLDNLYMVNNPHKEAVKSAVHNPDSLIDPAFGEVTWVKEPGAIRSIETPFVAQNSFAMLEYLDTVREMRTGVSRSTMALDLEALQNQTATAVNAAQSSSYTKVETYARNIAEVGLKRLFRCLLKLVVKHQDMPKVMRLRGDWVQMDPASWDADMDVTINVGLGSGSRDRDMAMLSQIAMQQKEILLTMGPVNPLCDISQYRNTLAKLVEAGGLKSPEMYFKEISPEDMQRLQQEQEQAKQQPDPKTMEAMQKLQLSQQESQAKLALQREEGSQRLQLDGQRMQLEMQMRQAEIEANRQGETEKIIKELSLKREQMMVEVDLRREQMAQEAQLKREAMALDAQTKQAVAASAGTSKVQMGGEVG